MSKKNVAPAAPRKRGRPSKTDLSAAPHARHYSKRRGAKSSAAKTYSRQKFPASNLKSAELPEAEAILTAQQPRLAATLPPLPTVEIPAPPPPSPNGAAAEDSSSAPELAASPDEIQRLRTTKFTLMVCAPGAIIAELLGWDWLKLSEIQAQSIVAAWDVSFPNLLDGLDRLKYLKWLTVLCATIAPFVENMRRATAKANDAAPDNRQVGQRQDDAGPLV